MEWLVSPNDLPQWHKVSSTERWKKEVWTCSKTWTYQAAYQETPEIYKEPSWKMLPMLLNISTPYFSAKPVLSKRSKTEPETMTHKQDAGEHPQNQQTSTCMSLVPDLVLLVKGCIFDLSSNSLYSLNFRQLLVFLMSNHKNIEYPNLEETQEDHWVQLQIPGRTF